MPLKDTPLRNTSRVPRFWTSVAVCAASVARSAPGNCRASFAHSLAWVAWTNSASSSASSNRAGASAVAGRSRYIGLVANDSTIPVSATFSRSWSDDLDMLFPSSDPHWA